MALIGSSKVKLAQFESEGADNGLLENNNEEEKRPSANEPDCINFNMKSNV